MKLKLSIDDTHKLSVNLTNITELTLHVTNEEEFREKAAALLAMRAPQEAEFNTIGTTSWFDFAFPNGDGTYDFEITLFVPDDLAPSKARAIIQELRKEQS